MALVRRLIRILLNVATAASLVLFVATAAMWGRSILASDRLFRQSWFDEAGNSYWIQDVVLSGSGGIGVSRIVQGFPNTPLHNGMTIRQDNEARRRQVPLHASGPPRYPEFRVG